MSSGNSDKPYKYEADFKDVLQDFALKFILEQPDDIAEFGFGYFKVLKERGIVIKVDEYVEFEPDDEEEISPQAMSMRRKTVFADQFNPEEEPNEEMEVYEKPPEDRHNLYSKAKNVMLLSSLDDEQFSQVLDAMFVKEVKAGENVINEGEDGDFFYIIDFGIFEATKKSGENIEPIRTYYHSGSFGELALMYNVPRSATITAQTDGRLWVMKRDSFRRIVLTSAFRKRKLYEEILGKVPMLSTLEPYERLNLADALEPRAYTNGEKIINQNDAADGMFFVESGAVEVYVIDENGKEVTINMLEKGDYFGEIALVTHKPRVASARAKGQVKLAFLHVEAFERLLGPCMEIMKRNLSQYEEQMKLILNQMSSSAIRS